MATKRTPAGKTKAPNAKQKRVVGYLRQSLDRTGEGIAVERQRTECQRFADENGLEVVRWFVDNDVSATHPTKERPAFEAMLKDIQSERVDAILAWHNDRVTRRLSDLERLIKLDMDIYTVTSGRLNLMSSEGRATARTVAVWSMYEGDQKAARQLAMHRQRLERTGKGWGSRRAFGFQQGNLKHDKREAKLLREMYDRYLAGETQTAIARWLNSKGVTTTMGGKWTQPGVHALLRNPRNAGLLTYHGKIVDAPAAWEPIVDVKVFRAAKARMTPGTPRKSNARKYLLAGIAECGVCGATMRSGHGSDGVNRYECRAKFCTRRNGPKLEEFVILGLCLFLSDSKSRHLLAPTKLGAAETKKAVEDLEDIDERVAGLAESFAAGLIPLDVYQSALQTTNARKIEISRQLGTADTSAVVRELVDDTPEQVRKRFDALPLDRQREAIVGVFQHIRVLPTKRGGRFRPEDVELI